MEISPQDNSASAIFKYIRPKCVALAQLTLTPGSNSGSMELLNSLIDLDTSLQEAIELNSSSGDLIELPTNLADYVMLPITELLKKPSITDSELDHCLSIIHILIIHCWGKPGSMPKELFLQFIPLVTFLIGGKPNEFSIESHSDETFLNGILCLKALLEGCEKQADGFAASILSETKLLPSIGHMISVLLNISLLSPITEIKVGSLETLNILYHLLNDGEILSIMFPGNVSTIAKIIKSKPHSKVVAQAFTMLSNLVNNIFNDYELDVEVKEGINSLDDLKEKVDGSDDFDHQQNYEEVDVVIPDTFSSSKKHRTSSWLKATLYQFRKALKIILNLDDIWYDKYVVKESLFQFDIKILRNSFKSCNILVPLIIQSLSTLCSYDESYKQLVIDSLVYSSNVSSLNIVCQKILSDELETLDYSFNSPDSDKTNSKLKFLNFLMTLNLELGSMEEYLVESMVHKIASCLTFLFQSLNSTSMKRNRMISTQNSFSSPKTQNIEAKLLLISTDYLKDNFENNLEQIDLFNGILTKGVEKSLDNLISALAKVPGIQSNIAKYLNDSDDEVNGINIILRNSVNLWLVSSILKQVKTGNQDNMDDFLNFDDNDDDNDYNGSSHEEPLDLQLILQDNVYLTIEKATKALQICSSMESEISGVTNSTIMALRSISSSVDFLGKDFDRELIDVLFPIIECLGSSSELIRIESQIVTMKIADMLYDGSVTLLLRENSDYLIDSLSIKMMGDSLTPKLPIVLIILIKIGAMDLLRELDDIITTIFTLLDTYYGYTSLVEGFFLVFNEVIDQIIKSNLKDFDFERLSVDLQEDDVYHLGLWGLKSMSEVEEFINRKSDIPDDILGSDSDDDDDGDAILKKDKILEIDSDNDSDDDGGDNNTNEVVEGQSVLVDKENPQKNDDLDHTRWMSPLDPKLYGTVTNILAYSERLMQTKSINLTITIMKLIKKLIPILATQKNKFLPLAADLWELISYTLSEYKDYRIIDLSLEILKQLIKYGNTFFTSRFIDFFRLTIGKNKFILSLINKEVEIQKKRLESKETKLLNRSSTSLNWEVKTYNQICEFLIFCLVKFGRFISNDIAITIIDITIYYDHDETDYGYFDHLCVFLKKFRKIATK